MRPIPLKTLTARRLARLWLAGMLLALAVAQLAAAHQADPGQNPPPPPPPQPQDRALPAAGGPNADSGVIALPKKKAPAAEAPPPAPAQPVFRNPPGAGNYTLRMEVPEVDVEVGVLLEKTRQFVPGLKPENFRIFEDGVEQKVLGFKRVEAPITALLLCEFAATNYYFVYDMRNAALAFAKQLRPQDYVALMTFDLKSRIVMDFSQDKNLLLQAVNSLVIPSFNDRDLYDAMYEALDRLNRVEGRKYILLIASGRDTFSRITFDKILQKIKATPDVTIFTVSTGGMLRVLTEGGAGWGRQMRDMNYLMADNQMKTFASLTGGIAFFPRFEGEMPGIFSTINASIRSRYQLIYRPTNTRQDGAYRKLRVQLVDEEGKPLRLQDQKRKPLKYEIVARDGYRARREVE